MCDANKPDNWVPAYLHAKKTRTGYSKQELNEARQFVRSITDSIEVSYHFPKTFFPSTSCPSYMRRKICEKAATEFQTAGYVAKINSTEDRYSLTLSFPSEEETNSGINLDVSPLSPPGGPPPYVEDDNDDEVLKKRSRKSFCGPVILQL